ncbi:hypothetical protein R1flu_018717 [Riccia fluitans]|uniref:4-hydroxy-tetrahydrodipicolinate reductase n=1 Tax=Riccia fluitans TaxID=41844 RepID=A0ABD1ZK48_9MARC
MFKINSINASSRKTQVTQIHIVIDLPVFSPLGPPSQISGSNIRQKQNLRRQVSHCHISMHNIREKRKVQCVTGSALMRNWNLQGGKQVPTLCLFSVREFIENLPQDLKVDFHEDSTRMSLQSVTLTSLVSHSHLGLISLNSSSTALQQQQPVKGFVCCPRRISFSSAAGGLEWPQLKQPGISSRASRRPNRNVAERNLGIRAAGMDGSEPSSEKYIMINDCNGRMGRAVAEAAIGAGLKIAPYTITGGPVPEEPLDILGSKVKVCGKERRDEVLDLVRKQYSGLVMVDYTVPDAVNENAELYCKYNLPFVMGTSGGDRERLLTFARSSGNYAVIAPQMGKQVVAFQAAMEIMAKEFPGAFSGYKLEVTESHQSNKLDTSGTAKEIVKSFQKLGLDFNLDQIGMVRDADSQIAMGVPSEHLGGHAFHTYRLTSPDNTVEFKFEHNVCGRSIYAQGTVDAVLFLMKKIEEKSEKKVFNMIDVLHEGAMR